jgi:hypothetical protein
LASLVVLAEGIACRDFLLGRILGCDLRDAILDSLGTSSMFRFTIRDVLWLTVVVALGIVWQLDRMKSQSDSVKAAQKAREREEQLIAYKTAAQNEAKKAQDQANFHSNEYRFLAQRLYKRGLDPRELISGPREKLLANPADAAPDATEPKR